jgi:hypothetical protein
MVMHRTISAKRVIGLTAVVVGLVLTLVAWVGMSSASPTTGGPLTGRTVAPSGSTPTSGPRLGSKTVPGGLAQPIVGAASTSSGKGYWLVASDGGVFASGDAPFLGSLGAVALNQPIVGIAATPSGGGYWLVASDGGVFTFGNARFFGSTGNVRLTRPVVGMASTASGNGYWLVASDGGIFSFGDAAFYGSTGAVALTRPIVAMTSTRTGQGYWLVANDGGVFTFGDAAFHGSAGGAALPGAIVGMSTDGTGRGYWLAGQDGSVYPYGDAPAVGSAAGVLGQPVAAMTAPVSGAALWLAGRRGMSVSLPSMTVYSVGGGAGSAAGGASSSYTFLATNPDGSAVRWNPCQPIHYVTNLAMAPPTAAGDVAGALARVSAATGITFVNDGATTEVPSTTRASQQSRYGSGWAPVLIAWSVPGQSNLLPGNGVLGEGGASWVSPANGAPGVYVSGVVDVDAGASAMLAPGFGGGLTMGDLLLHEIGHVVGLGHTTDQSQVMYPDILARGSSSYGAGDLNGFRHLGTTAGCVATPAP